jgi:antitoxin (DNA-binding transcriptional repressor) of toxin-antitoxin stability system
MIMQYITTTDLRTQSSQLVQTLLQGNAVSLIHRSQIVGQIAPVAKQKKQFDIKKLREYMTMAEQKDSLSDQEREKHYRDNLMQKYGKTLS